MFSPTIGRQLLELGLIDEIDLQIASVMLGQGIRLYDNPEKEPIRLHHVGEDRPDVGLKRALPTHHNTRGPTVPIVTMYDA